MPAPLPDDGVFEAQLGGALLDLLLQPGLWAHQVLDELGHPPDGGVAVETMQAWGQVLRDGQGEVGWPRVQTVHNRQLHNLDVLIMGLSWVVQERGIMSTLKIQNVFKKFDSSVKVRAVTNDYVCQIYSKHFFFCLLKELYGTSVLCWLFVHVSRLHF